LILDAQFSHRSLPLVIAGPPGVQERVEAAMEVFFPGSAGKARPFAIEFIELEERVPTSVGPASVTPFAVRHPSGAPAYALRVEYAGKAIAYSGDAEWTEALVEAARDTDLFVCECTFFAKEVPNHLNYRTLLEQRPRLDCRRLVLTHLGQEMLDHLEEVEVECAGDGQVIAL
jgi:ribonuclease BN (tRNA processing enzyme)